MLKYCVVKAEYIKDYTVMVSFYDGTRKRVDLSSALKGPVFEPLKDKVVFSQFEVHPDLDTIVWKNGADIAPEYLYEHGVDVL